MAYRTSSSLSAASAMIGSYVFYFGFWHGFGVKEGRVSSLRIVQYC